MNILNNEEAQPKSVDVDTNVGQQNSDTNLSQNQETNNINAEQQDANWKAFREARKQDRIEREAAEKKAAEKEAEIAALKAAMEAAFSKNAPTTQAYQQYYGMNSNNDYEQEETEDEKIEKKLNKILAAREEKYNKEQQEREYREYPNKIKREFPDFSQVCSQENLDYLEYHYPELARPLQRLPDGYDKWSDIYHAVKKFIPNHSNMKREAAKVEINTSKPRSISSPNMTSPGIPVRDNYQDTEQRRASNWERMKRIMNGVG